MSSTAPQGNWFKSSHSEASNACVEICLSDAVVGVRDSKHAGGPELWFTGEQWDRFLRSLL
ncbi:DUF397 domain-containing protein [Nocardia sp. NPDC057668]|uniref:DUF397 domain-containing protein n=1 Tax=Nocardia sp. NPDC057668 TaxID=3346202 RepID=UPI00366B5514